MTKRQGVYLLIIFLVCLAVLKSKAQNTDYSTFNVLILNTVDNSSASFINGEVTYRLYAVK